MKTPRFLLKWILPVLLISPLAGATDTGVVSWNFNDVPDTPEAVQSPPPSSGVGHAALTGGVSSTLAAGVPGADGGRAWNATRFPAQGRSQASAGMRFAASTVGWHRIQLRFQHRFSARSSGRAVVRVTANGVDFVEAASYVADGADQWIPVAVDLPSIPEAADNAAFAFEVVSAFAVGTNRYPAAGSGSTYSSAGTWRLDNVEVLGEKLTPAPTGPAVRVSPADRILAEGNTLRLGVGAGGTEPLEYQWQQDGEDLPGETASILLREVVTAASAGRYRVRVSNAYGSVSSGEAVVTVNPPPPPYVERSCATLHGLVVGPDFASPAGGPLVAVEGIVISHANLTSSGNLLFFLQDATGGIAIQWRGQSAESLPAAGARIRVVGPVVQSDGLLQVAPLAGDPMHSVTVLEEGLPLPAAVELDPELLSDPVRMESMEGRRVRVSGVTLDTRSPLFPSRGANLTMTSLETAAPVVLRVAGDSKGAWVDLADQPKPSGPFTVTGVWSQDDSSRPFTSGYRLVPTRYADLVPAGHPPEVRWSVVLDPQLRKGDAVTNEFAEQVLRPGESLRVTAEFSNDSGTLHPADGIILPVGATLNWVSDSESGTGGNRLTAAVSFLATAAHEGQRHRIQLRVAGSEATRRMVWTVYVPTLEERQVLITEILAHPVTRVDAPGFNPLQRDEWPPVDDAGVESRISAWDEFVELINLGPAPVNLGGWTLSDATRIQAWISPESPEVVMPAGGALVVYGGPPERYRPVLRSPTFWAELAGGASAGTDGLGLNNTGDSLLLRNAAGELVERIVFASRSVPAGVSLVRWPVPEGPWVLQPSLDATRMATPGLPPVGEDWPGSGSAQGFTVRVGVDGSRVRLDWEVIPGATYSVRQWDWVAATWNVLASGLTDPRFATSISDARQRLFQVTSP